MERDNSEIVKAQFFALKTREDVAAILGIEDKSLRYFLYKKRPENMYHTFEIPKRKGGIRKISAPSKELKEIQKKLAAVLKCVYKPKPCAYGFVDKRSYVDNAKRHIKRNLLLNIDLKDFFSQIHFGRVRGTLIHEPYMIGEQAATVIAQIACLNGVLPQGAPSSPILTNMICVPLDNNLMKLAKMFGYTYTRYADDITFSTYKKFFDESFVCIEQNAVHIGKELVDVMKKHSFEINSEKVSLRTRYDRQEVTGLTVNVFPNIRRSYIKQLRAILHHCKIHDVLLTAKEYVAKGQCKNEEIKKAVADPSKDSEVEAWFKKVLIGKVNFIKQIKGNDDLQYLSFAQQLNAVLKEDAFDISALNYLDAIIAHNVYVIEHDDGTNFTQGSGFYLDKIGLFTSYHVTKNGAFFKVFLHCTYPGAPLGTIGKDMNEVAADECIDYAVYAGVKPADSLHLFKIGDSSALRIGDQVITAGYPNHQTGNSPYIQTCNITSKKGFHGSLFYTISGRIPHGSSGGVVMNRDYEVVGIIKGGIVSLSDDPVDENQGFVPIHVVLEHCRHLQTPNDFEHS